MKKVILLLLLIASARGYSQAKFHVDTVFGIKPHYYMDSFVNAYMRFVNVGNKSFYDEVSVYYKTDFNDTPKFAGKTPFKYYIKPKDTTYVWVYFKITPKYFQVDLDNIVVVWPTGGGVMPVDSFSQKTKVTKYIATSITDKGLVSGLVNIFPNPTRDGLKLDVINKEATIQSAQLYSLQGKLEKMEDAPEGYFDMNEIPAGTYILVLRFKDGSKSRFRVIKSE